MDIRTRDRNPALPEGAGFGIMPSLDYEVQTAAFQAGKFAGYHC